jgi:hypothetical protein
VYTFTQESVVDFPLNDIVREGGTVDVDLVTATVTMTVTNGSFVECTYVHCYGTPVDTPVDSPDGEAEAGAGLPDAGSQSGTLIAIALALVAVGTALTVMRRVHRSL